MIPSTAILIFSLPLALAQYGGPAPNPTPSSSAMSSAAPSSTDSSSSSIQTVTVGENGAIAFNPSTITAAKGSQVEFIFFPSSHSVVQASFDKPCQPISDSGFFSGAFTTTSGSNANSFTLTINDTSPIWFFCGFPTHCATGMVGVINPPSDNSQTLDQFKSAASKVSSTTDPTFSAQGGLIGPVKAASSGGGSATSSAPPASSSTGSAVELQGSMAWAGLFATLMTGWGIAGLMG